MPRGSYTAPTTSGAERLDMRVMLADGSIQNGKNTKGVISWDFGGYVQYEAHCEGENKNLFLKYILVDKFGKEVLHEVKIQITTQTSNLGFGEVLYFYCNRAHRQTRVLYRTFGSTEYVHRDYYKENYGVRLYYPCQSSSKGDYSNTMYFSVKRQVDALEEFFNTKHRKTHYAGRRTKKFQRLQDLKLRLDYLDQKRCAALWGQISRMQRAF